jgi:hypothetical protein
MAEYGAGGSINQHELNPIPPTPDGTWHPEEYQNVYHERTWAELAPRNWLWSKLIWVMFDYASDGRREGDTFGRNDKGLVTYDRATKKDSFFFYKANWSSEPVTYITSRRWVNRPHATTPIKIYSNAPQVELVVNGVSLGIRTGTRGVFEWPIVALRAGDNTVEAFGIRNGNRQRDAVNFRNTVSSPNPNPNPIHNPNPSPSASVTGIVFHDVNRNAARDASEPGLANRLVYLDLNNNGRLDTAEPNTRTDSDGTYWLTNLPNGTHKLRHNFAEGNFTQTTPSNGWARNITVTTGLQLTNITFGAGPPGNTPLPPPNPNPSPNPNPNPSPTGSRTTLSGLIFADQNNNRILDASESGLAGWTVYIDANNNGTRDASEIITLTDATGRFSFANLPLGWHKIRLDRPSGWIQTTPTNDFGLNGQVTNTSTTTDTGRIGVRRS